MKKFSILLLINCVACSPASRFNKDRALFASSADQMSFKSVANMNDAYFVTKENDFFEFYRLLFDSVKNSRYPGRYSKKGDTLLLDFYDKKGTTVLGNKAVIDTVNKKIMFFK